MELEELRKKYPQFVYKDYSYQIKEGDLKISFSFEVPPDINFQPSLTIKNVKESQIKKIKEGVLNNLVFHLGLIEVLSYWKATCSPKIKVKAGSLGRKRINWWKDLIIQGMGEYFYQNQINWKRPKFISITSQSKKTKPTKLFKGKLKKELLVPIGGGKDSPVSLEIIKKAELPFTCFSLNSTPSAAKIIELSSDEKPITATRKIDPELLKLNKKGFLNGHTPFSAYLAFLSVLVAVLFNKQRVAFSNERSANEGNLKYLGEEINHQYSKSFDFEKNFVKYCRAYLAKNLGYFSLLRPLYSLQVGKIFARYPKYFPHFLSCNEAFKTDSGTKKPQKKWCGKCAKCLFVFTVLYPFVKEGELVRIFGKNLFEDKELLPLMRKLIGVKKPKPFECVGTTQESLAAFYLSWKKANRVGESPPLLKYFRDKIIPRKIQKGFIKGRSQYPALEKEAQEVLTSWNKKHNLSKKLVKELEDTLIIETNELFS